tara:strand:+ start:7519 stop:7734 length:216 start_codon:yes stop_codon:yes gene_type:complete
MSNYYTKYVTPTIIYFIEEGEKTVREIAKLCKVSEFYVKKVRDMYEQIYIELWKKDGNLQNNSRRDFTRVE